MAKTGVPTQISSYEEACASHRWDVPERYNIAADVCDKHPRDKLAMVWEDFRGNERQVSWGELQSLSAQAANVLRAHGVERGDRIAVVAPATRGDRGRLLRHLEARRRSCSRCRCFTATRGSATESRTRRRS